jgi:hypothetical protein
MKKTGLICIAGLLFSIVACNSRPSGTDRESIDTALLGTRDSIRTDTVVDTTDTSVNIVPIPPLP